ncbi:MAG TPA: zf-HC2 domain-containing protein [Polyangiaceae bacterium]
MSDKPMDLQCRQVVELVNEYLGNRLMPEDRAAFEAHLQTCPPCTTYLAQIETVLDTARSLAKVPPSANVEQELMALFQRWIDKGSH